MPQFYEAKLFCPNFRDEKNQCIEIVSNLYNSTQREYVGVKTEASNTLIL